MKTLPQKTARLSCFIAALFLSSCATRVTPKTDPAELSSGPVGYLAFHYETTTRESAEFYARRVETGKTYRFSLDNTPSSLYVSAGPFLLYEKLLGSTTLPPLTLIPLPAGHYECRFIYARIPYSPWLAFLRQQNSALLSKSLKNKSFNIAPEQATYIGTYQASAKAGMFSSRYRLETSDDGDSRAALIGIQDHFVKSIVEVE